MEINHPGNEPTLCFLDKRQQFLCIQQNILHNNLKETQIKNITCFASMIPVHIQHITFCTTVCKYIFSFCESPDPTTKYNVNVHQIQSFKLVLYTDNFISHTFW